MAIKAGIVGGAGYTAGELLRLLTIHPEVEVAFVHSTSNAGNRVGEVHSGLEDVELTFTDELPLNAIDVLFICSAHGQSSVFLAEHQLPEHVRVIDLAQDFRDEHDGFIYGLPELQRSQICGARKVANPGCFATAIQLSLLPLAAAGLLPESVQITGITGSTGAGVKPGATTHFSWRNNNLSVYKAFG
ncbi:MAG: N-acetyl-gamma-glutamyl-phosphate reductase, partial [Muribaculaceae bacterium]|nr:N-acetyl-gamma-glutamyl-phosphate reductase [Muribaculaceae bacterium]